MSVLQDMTRGIIGPKAEKARKLTPVAGETAATMAQFAAATLPNDVGVLMSNESLWQAAKDMRAHAATLITIAEGIEKLTGEPPYWKAPVESDPAKPPMSNKLGGSALIVNPTKAEKAATKATYEQEADARVKAMMVEIAPGFPPNATLASLDDGAEEPAAPVTPADGWVCPKHGAESLVTLTSRRKRVYKSCTSCGEFERES